MLSWERKLNFGIVYSLCMKSVHTLRYKRKKIKEKRAVLIKNSPKGFGEQCTLNAP